VKLFYYEFKFAKKFENKTHYSKTFIKIKGIEFVYKNRFTRCGLREHTDASVLIDYEFTFNDP